MDTTTTAPANCTGEAYTTYTTSLIPTSTIVTIPVSYTTSLVSTYATVTIPITSYFPYSCFTYYVATAQSNNAFCGTLSRCPPRPDCIVRSTFSAPCKDPCCPFTSTFVSLGGCATCQTGCATDVVTVTRSTDCSAIITPTPF